MLFVSNPGRPIVLTHICGYSDIALTIPLLGGIAMVQVNWNFNKSNVDHAATAPTIYILHRCCIMDVPTSCLVLLYGFRLGSRELLVLIFHIYFSYLMY